MTLVHTRATGTAGGPRWTEDATVPVRARLRDDCPDEPAAVFTGDARNGSICWTTTANDNMSSLGWFCTNAEGVSSVFRYDSGAPLFDASKPEIVAQYLEHALSGTQFVFSVDDWTSWIWMV